MPSRRPRARRSRICPGSRTCRSRRRCRACLPVHHGGGDEAEAVGAERQGVAFLYGECASLEVDPFEELGQHADGLRACRKCEGGICVQRPFYQRGVVGLHVVHHQIIRLAAGQRLPQVLFPLVGLAGVGGVQDGGLAVCDKVGIVGNPLGDDVLALEQVYGLVVGADVEYLVIEFSYHMAAKVAIFSYFCTCENGNRGLIMEDFYRVRQNRGVHDRRRICDDSRHPGRDVPPGLDIRG